MKSSPRMTNTKGGLAISDSLSNVVTSMGTGGDRSTYNRWTLGVPGAQGADILTEDQIVAAYRTDWVVRKAHDVPPEEMTKKWRTFDDTPQVTKKIAAEEKRLKLQEKMQEGLRLGLMGGGAIIMGLPGDDNTEARPGDIREGGLEFLHVVSRHQLTITELELDITSPNFGRPKQYALSGGEGGQVTIHPSRVAIFHGRPLPKGQVLASHEQFWGAPLLQSMNSAMQNSTLAQSSVAALLHEAKRDTISIPDLADKLSTSEGTSLVSRRLSAAALMGSMHNVLLLDGGSGVEGSPKEEWNTRQLNFSNLPQTMQAFLQMAAGAADMPVTRLLGTSPTGMNATGDHDEDNFLAMIASRQETDLKPVLEAIDAFMFPSAGAKPDVKWSFVKLKDASPTEEAEQENVLADTFSIIAETGLLQRDALHKVVVARLSASPNFPGLKEAVEASTEELPASEEADLASTSTEAKNTALLRPPAPAVKPPAGAKRRVKTGDAIADAAPRSLYVSRSVANPQELLNWFRAQNMPNLVAAGDLHVTVAFSRRPLDWMAIPEGWGSNTKGQLLITPGGPRVIEPLGTEGAVVQFFKSSELQWRHDAIKEAGASWDFESYQPHITMAYNLPADFDLASVVPYAGRILLGPELFSEVRKPGDSDDVDMVEA